MTARAMVRRRILSPDVCGRTIALGRPSDGIDVPGCDVRIGAGFPDHILGMTVRFDDDPVLLVIVSAAIPQALLAEAAQLLPYAADMRPASVDLTVEGVPVRTAFAVTPVEWRREALA